MLILASVLVPACGVSIRSSGETGVAVDDDILTGTVVRFRREDCRS